MDCSGNEEVKASIQEEYNKEALKLSKYNAEYNKFCEDNGLKRLQDRISVAKWNRSEAAKARSAVNKTKSVDNTAESGILKTNIQLFAKKAEDFPTVFLPRDEYAHVMSEIATNLTKEQAQKHVFSKYIGDYIYTVENKGFGNYRVIKKVPIVEEL